MQNLSNQVVNVRDQVQADSIAAWKEYNKRGTIVLAPGYGKTKVALDVIAEYPISEVLIVVPTQVLKSQWEEQTKARVVCTSTAVKLKERVSLLVVDECHLTLSRVYRTLYEGIKHADLLCLTGTEPHTSQYRDVLQNIAPICFTRSVEEALSDNAISDFKVYNVSVPIDKETKAKYDLWCRKHQEASYELMDLNREHRLGSSLFEIAKMHKDQEDSPACKASKLYWFSMSNRRRALQDSKGKVAVAARIVKTRPDKRWIVFTKSIEVLEALHREMPWASVYHSKMSTKDRDENIRRYVSGETNILLSVSALNQGLNIPNIDAALCVSYDSTPLTFQQQLGRTTRINDSKIATFVNLYYGDSQEEKWLRNKLGNIECRWLSPNESNLI